MYFSTCQFGYKSDCELLNICNELGATYGVCYKDADILSKRCEPAQKQAILNAYKERKLRLEIQARQEEQQLREEKLLLLRDKQAVRRSWIQLFVAAVAGGIIAAIINLLTSFIAGTLST